MVDRNTSVRQHRREVTIADRKSQIPAQRPQDYRRREVPSLKGPVLSRHHLAHLSKRLASFYADPTRANLPFATELVLPNQCRLPVTTLPLI